MPDEQQAIRRLDAATIESVMDFLIYLHDCRDPDMGIPCAFHARERRQAIDVTYEQGIAAYRDAIAGEAPGLDVPTIPEWRRILWEHHGHDGLYGDDGEMQCNRYPPVDFRRHHIDALIAHIGWTPIAAAYADASASNAEADREAGE